jgi:cation/acetate symporter
MNIDPWILTFSAVTVLVTVWMGFWSAKKSRTASDFFVAGRSVSVGWNSSAISGEYLSAASFMGIAGMVMSSGYDALWYPVCYACGYLFLLLFIAGPLRRFGAYTIPDFAEGRFDSPLFRKIAVIFVLFIGFFYTMPQMKGAGVTLAYIFPGLPYWAGVVLVGAVITFNVALGGMKGITLVQAFQYWIKMFAISVPIFVLMSVYGHYGAALSQNDGQTLPPIPAAEQGAEAPLGWQEVAPMEPKAELSVFGRAGRFFSEQVLGRSEHTFSPAAPGRVWILPLLEQASDVRGTTYLVAREMEEPSLTFGHRTELAGAQWVRAVEGALRTARISYRDRQTQEQRQDQLLLIEDGPGRIKVVPLGQASAYQAAGLLALVPPGRAPLPERAPGDQSWLNPFGPLTTKAATAAGLSPEQARPYSLLYTYSLIIALVCGTAGLPHILVRFYTNPDGVAAKRTTMWVMILIGVFYVFPPVFGAMGRNLLPDLYAAAGAKGTDKIVLELPRLLNERVPMLGSILSGITCAGAFAAFMSTFSGLLVSMTGALAHDVYGRILRPGSTPDQRMRMFKVSAVLIGAIAIFLGMQVEPFQINFMVGQAFAIAAASYFPLLFMSVWWRGLTMKGAATGMLAGGMLALGGISLTSFSDLGWLKLGTFWVEHPLLRILCEQPAIWAVPLAIGLMVIVSKLTRKSVPPDVRMKMLVLHAPEKLGLKQEYIQEHTAGH